MSGRNPKISNSRFSAPRFGTHDRKPNSEVIVYHLPPEEIREQYGSGPADILTKEKFRELQVKKFSLKQMSEILGIPYVAVKYLATKYKKQGQSELLVQSENKGVEEMEVIREKEIFINESEILPRTRENYLKLKGKGLSEKEIAEHFGMIKTNLPRYKKKWGLMDATDCSQVGDKSNIENNQLVDQLEKQIIQLQEQVKMEKTCNDKLQRKNNELEQQLEHVLNEKNHLIQRLQQQQDSSSKLYNESIQAIEKYDQTSKELHEAITSIDQLRSDKEKLETRIRELLQEYQGNCKQDVHTSEVTYLNSYLADSEEENRLFRKTLKRVL